MASTRASGGPGRGAYRHEWRGAQFHASVRDQIGTGVQDLAQDILDDLHQTIHIDSGEMNEKAFSEVSVDNTKRTIRAGSAADHAIFEELLHHPITQVIDRQAPRFTAKIAAARGGGR